MHEDPKLCAELHSLRLELFADRAAFHELPPKARRHLGLPLSKALGGGKGGPVALAFERGFGFAAGKLTLQRHHLIFELPRLPLAKGRRRMHPVQRLALLRHRVVKHRGLLREPSTVRVEAAEGLFQ
jgi:hypothetical protein